MKWILHPNQHEISKAELQELAFLITESKHTSDQNILAWSNFEQVFDTDSRLKSVSNICHLPMIYVPASKYDKIWREKYATVRVRFFNGENLNGHEWHKNPHTHAMNEKPAENNNV